MKRRATTQLKRIVSRRHGVAELTDDGKVTGVPLKEIAKLSKTVNSDATLTVCRNAITSVGSVLACTNRDEIAKPSHIFSHSLKKPDLKATDQGHSGRCWMFAGLNVFRHQIIHALNLDNFEFSQTYLFFFDKLERCYWYLKWFEAHPDIGFDSREVCSMEWLGDGGYWNYFANLVSKYGVVPKQAMAETWQSADTDDMNERLVDIVQSSILKMDRSQNTEDVIFNAMQNVYRTLVLYLGEPPETFDWVFEREDMSETSRGKEVSVMEKTTPAKFMSLLGAFDVEDFVVLTHFPLDGYPYNKTYSIKRDTNMWNAPNCKVMNVPLKVMKKYTKLSVTSGIPVWFAGDVSKDFHWYTSCLNPKLFSTDEVFGETEQYSKDQRLMLHNSAANHAMVIVGVNLDSRGKPTEWEIENSWGYYDNEEKGLDGFLSMSDEWYDKWVYQVVVHKSVLSENLKRVWDSTGVEVEPWDYMGTVAKVTGTGRPRDYWKKVSENRF